MTFDQQTEGSTEVIKISETTSILAAALLALSIMVLAAIALVITIKPVPYVLIGLMIVTIVMVGQLAYLTAQSLWGTTLKLDADGIAIERFLDKSAYPWHEIADVRVVYSGGMLNDNPRTEEEDRLALGVYLKGGLAGSLDDRDPDIVLCGGSAKFASQLDRLADTIKRHRTRHTTKPKGPQNRARISAQVPEFRRRAGSNTPSTAGGAAGFAPAAKVPFGKRQD